MSKNKSSVYDTKTASKATTIQKVPIKVGLTSFFAKDEHKVCPVITESLNSSEQSIVTDPSTAINAQGQNVKVFKSLQNKVL